VLQRTLTVGAAALSGPDAVLLLKDFNQLQTGFPL